MATKVQKKELIRKQIIEAANIYSQKLAGKKFLYVTSNYYFEILFLTDKFYTLQALTQNLQRKTFMKKHVKGYYKTTNSILIKNILLILLKTNSQISSNYLN